MTIDDIKTTIIDTDEDIEVVILLPQELWLISDETKR